MDQQQRDPLLFILVKTLERERAMEVRGLRVSQYIFECSHYPSQNFHQGLVPFTHLGIAQTTHISQHICMILLFFLTSFIFLSPTHHRCMCVSSISMHISKKFQKFYLEKCGNGKVISVIHLRSSDNIS